MPLRHDPARQAGRRGGKRRHLVRIERHRGHRAGIVAQHLRHPLRHAHIAVEPAFHFEHQRHPAGDHVAELAERHDAVARGLKRHALQIGGRQFRDAAGRLRQAVER